MVPQRRFRFGLKTLLLVTVCTGFALGAIAKFALTVAAKSRAIDGIAASGQGMNAMFAADGTYVGSSDDPDPKKVCFLGLSPQDVAENIRRCTVIESVTELDFMCQTFESQSLVGVKSNPRIKTISLQGCYGLTDQTCSLLVEAFPHACEIDFRGAHITESGLAVFSSLKFLRRIDVTELAIPATDVVRVCESFPALDHVILNHADLSGQLDRFCRYPHLRELDVCASRFSESDLARFLDRTACNRVCVIGVELDRRTLQSLVQNKEKLSILDWGWSLE